jgi:hypothetical protein
MITLEKVSAPSAWRVREPAPSAFDFVSPSPDLRCDWLQPARTWDEATPNQCDNLLDAASYVESSELDKSFTRALTLYELGNNSYAIDEFAHKLIDHVVDGSLDVVDETLRNVSRRIATHIGMIGTNAVRRDFYELELWLAAATLTRGVGARLKNRLDYVHTLRTALEQSSHEDKGELLKVVN